MAVALRLMRFGKKGFPTYRIVVLDKRSKRDGYYIEKIGLYNPMTDKNQIIIDEERFQYWVKTGAQVSDGIRKLLSVKLPKLTSRVSKPKIKKVAKPAEAKEAAPAVAAPAVDAAPTEPAKEVPPAEAPVEAPKETPVAPETPPAAPSEEAKTE